MTIDQFENDTRNIFKEAGAKMTPPLHDQVFNKLCGLMAGLSVTEGLSWNRVKKYEEQKTTFIQDLKEGILNGNVEKEK